MGFAALRQGSLTSISDRHKHLRGTLHRAWLEPVIGALGDALPATEIGAEATRTLLTWSVAQLRPDGREGLDQIDETAWLHSTSWRPLLTMACHLGLLQVPHFPQRYRRRQDEPALENLCGIWAVGPSTVYRYLDKARRQCTDLFSVDGARGPQRLGLRRAAAFRLAGMPAPAEGWEHWHRSQAQRALLGACIADGLWHFHAAGDAEAILDALKRFGPEAAASSETDALLAGWESSGALSTEQRIELLLRRGAMGRFRHDQPLAEEVFVRALRTAESLGDPLYIGITQAALGRHLEERDRDRSIGLYEDSLRWLRKVIGEPQAQGKHRAVNEYAECIVHLAWLHLRRNNPQARTLLEQVPAATGTVVLDEHILASMEQTWSEYWRCNGDPKRALEHQHRALAIQVRLSDQRAILNTYRNLSLLYSDAREFGLAREYGMRVVTASRESAIEPEVLAGAYGNLGVASFSLGDIDGAIAHYRRALEIEEQSGLSSHLIISHYNLAEASYERFKRGGDPADERQGDHHVAAAVRLSTDGNAHAQADAARSLKREVLGTGDGPDRLLPTEHAAHFAEMAEIERLRLGLALPQSAEQRVRAHLAIARAYLTIATKEREAAVAIAERHGLQTAEFQTEIDALRSTFSRELTREQRLDDAWNHRGGDLLAKERRQSVLAHMLTQGSINKSAYAEAAAVSLATASKHLGLLAERGLLVQTGKGPSTRYLLPSQ